MCCLLTDHSATSTTLVAAVNVSLVVAQIFFFRRLLSLLVTVQPTPAAGTAPRAAGAPAAAAAALPRPVVLPDEFAGTSGDWRMAGGPILPASMPPVS